MGTLKLNKCTKNVVNNLPDGMQVRGDLLYLYNWLSWKDDSRDDVYSIPENLKVSGNMVLNSKVLRHFPQGVAIGGNLYMRHANQLKSISNTFKVGKSLVLPFSSIQFLPDYLKIGYHCDLQGCQDLKNLPNNMKIGGCLDISFCRKLSKIPEDLYIGGWVVYYYRTKVKKDELPIHLKAKFRWDKNNPYLRV